MNSKAYQITHRVKCDLSHFKMNETAKEESMYEQLHEVEVTD